MNKPKSIRITSGAKPHIIVDGVDITHLCRSFELSQQAGCLPMLKLEMYAYDAETEGSAVLNCEQTAATEQNNVQCVKGSNEC